MSRYCAEWLILQIECRNTILGLEFRVYYRSLLPAYTRLCVNAFKLAFESGVHIFPVNFELNEVVFNRRT